MTHPNDEPASAELTLLREIRDEMRSRFHTLGQEMRVVINEQQRLASILATMVTAPRTPIPTSVSDSWLPDGGHGDNGR